MVDNKKLKELKLIVFDLDGTLLDDNGDIGLESQKLIKKLKEHGTQFTFASGRLHSSLKYYADQLGLKLPLISLDGALIKNNYDGTILFESVIPLKKVLKTLGYANLFLTMFAICHSETIYYTEHNENIYGIIEKYGADFIEVEDYTPYMKNCLELVLATEVKENLININNKLNFPYSFGLNTNLYKSHSSEGIYCLEVRKAGVSKGKALKRLLSKLGISIGNTAVIGDWYNDKSLFETNALKVAPANAIAEIKYLAQVVTKRTNNEDAVAEFLTSVITAKTGR